MKIRVLICLVACLALVAGCRKNSAQIAAQVKEEMQQEFTRKPGLKNLVVESVRLVEQSKTDLTGVAVGSINGEYVKFNVNCKYDGTSILWNADLAEGCLDELKVKEAARETYQLLKESWPKVKASIGEKYDAALKSVAEGCNAAMKKTGEYYNRAREQASEILEEAGRQIKQDVPSGEPTKE